MTEVEFQRIHEILVRDFMSDPRFSAVEFCRLYKSLRKLYDSQVVPKEAVAHGTFVPNFNGGNYKAGGGIKINDLRDI